MTNSTQLRSLIEPVWQEISSLWSGVDFPFSEPMPDPAAQLEPALPARTLAEGAASPRFPNGSHNVRLRAGARSSAG